jgi:hypothetical protein
MLPVVKRKTLEIPHGLAAIAAAVCLGLSFVSDFQAREQQLRADSQTHRPAIESVSGVVEERVIERASAPEPQTAGRRDHSDSKGSALLLWIPLQRTGG